MTNLLIVFHSLYSLAGGVDNRLSTLETLLPKDIKREFLLFKENNDLPHIGKINICDSIYIPKFVLRRKHTLKILAYFFGFINLLFRVYKTRKFVKKNEFETILAVDDYFSIVSIFAAIGLNKKIICSVRNNWDELYNGEMIHLLPDFFYKKILPKLMNKYCSHVHCVSSQLSKILKDTYKVKNTTTIYNIFEIGKIIDLAKEENKLTFPYFINIGHFNIQKNQKDLITAYKILKETYNAKEKLILIGDGPLLKECKQLVKEMKLENEIIFLGQQKNPYKYLHKATLYISSSLYEGLPAVFVESLILNIPIVSYDFDTGAKELTSNLSQQNPNSLADKVINVLSDSSIIKKSINEGKKLISNKFEKEKIINEWIKIL